MWSMAALAVASPDRFMFRGSRDVIMTGQANSSFGRLQTDDAAVDLMTFVAVTAARWRVNNFPEQTGVSGTMLSMAVDASRINRVTLVRLNKSGIGYVMAGSTQIGACQVQQARVVCRMGKVTSATALLNGGMNGAPGETCRIMTFKTQLLSGSMEKLGIFRVMHRMAGITVSGSNGLVHRRLTADIFKTRVTWQTDSRQRLPHQDCRYQSVGKMTSFAVLLLYRLMDNSRFIFGDHLRMTLGAGILHHRFTFDGCRSASGQYDQASQADDEIIP
jgi:hypothetical protein